MRVGALAHAHVHTSVRKLKGKQVHASLVSHKTAKNHVVKCLPDERFAFAWPGRLAIRSGASEL